ncbi:MAG: ABC transporter permease [Akkermansiaceae bacterium]|jgi:ABC-2 type transport system permease protein|nr:ABC transporter permease [Akkermansiaceae bacterium]
MMFLHQLYGEIRKLFARPRTYMGYGAFLIMELVIVLVYKFTDGQYYMRRLIERNGFESDIYFSSLSLTFLVMLFSMFLLGSIFFALVAGDVVAKENEDGNLRLVLARPISRLRLLLVKYTAVAVYTFTFVFFVGLTGYLMAVMAVGWQGGLFIAEQKMKVFAVYPEWGDGIARLAIGAAGIGVSMITLSSLAFMFSCFRIKPAAATIVTLAILFVDMILQNFPFFQPFEHWFITWRMSCWLYLMEKSISWPKIIEAYVFLGGLNFTFFMVGLLAFRLRDFKT